MILKYTNISDTDIASGEVETVTLKRKNISTREPEIITTPLNPAYCARVSRESWDGKHCLDVCLSWHMDLQTGLQITISIRQDGSIQFCGAEATGRTVGSANTYMHFARECGDRITPPSEGQRRTIARLYLGLDQIQGLGRVCPGGPVCTWAFAGHTPDQISAMYGDGSHVYLA
jgi:hypothetical protein